MTLEYNGKECMKKADPKEIFNYWVHERLDVLARKNIKVKKPWSKDPIFQTVYFCNVRREEDKTPKWIRQWTEDITSPISMMVWYTLARTLNNIDTLESLGEPTDDIDFAWLSTRLKNRRKQGKQIFGGAYLITTCGVKMDKLDYVLDLAASVKNCCSVCDTLEEQWLELTRVKGLGNFLAAQIVADLKNTQGMHWNQAEDFYTFVASGPGSIKGLNYFFERKPELLITNARFKKELEIVREYMDKKEDQPLYLCNQDLQNCLCEYSKYMRVLNGGRTKRNYQGL